MGGGGITYCGGGTNGKDPSKLSKRCSLINFESTHIISFIIIIFIVIS